VTFVKPDGNVEKLQVTSQKDATFSFTYVPDVVGSWTVSVWCLGAAYIMQSVDLPLNVVEPQEPPTEQGTEPQEQEQPTPTQDSGIPTEYLTVAATVIIAVIAVAAYLFMKKKNRSSPVLISD
jgi:hypothetical protein